MPADRSDRWQARLLPDPLGPLLAAVSVVVYALHGLHGYLSRDLALYAYAGQQFADGVPPYLGVVNRSGPLSHLVPGIGAFLARLVGGDDLIGMRVLFLVLSAGCVWLTYLLGRDLYSSRLSGVAAAAALLTVNGFTQYASNGPREKTTMVLFVICALLAVVRRRPFVAGLFVSLATLTWQPAFFVGVVAAVVGVWALDRGRRLRGLGAVVLGGMVPLAVFLVWYAAIGHLRDFLECFVLIHVNYTEQPSLEDLDWYGILQQAYGAALWVLFAGAAVLLLRGLWILARRGLRADPLRRTEVAMAVALVAGVLWSIRVFNGWPDIFFVLPLATLGIGALARVVSDLLPRPWPLLVTVGWVLAALALALDFSLGTRDDTLRQQQAEVDEVLRILPEDSTIVSIESPQALVLSGRTDPFRHQMFGLGLQDYVQDTWPGGLDGLRADIGERQPEVITMGKNRRVWMAPLLDTDYVRVRGGIGWTWYVNRSVGGDVLGELMSRSGHDRG